MRLLYTEKDLLLSACPARQSVPLTAYLVRFSVTNVFTREGNALSKHTLHTKFVLCASREQRSKPLSSTWPSAFIHQRADKLESVWRCTVAQSVVTLASVGCFRSPDIDIKRSHFCTEITGGFGAGVKGDAGSGCRFCVLRKSSARGSRYIWKVVV